MWEILIHCLIIAFLTFKLLYLNVSKASYVRSIQQTYSYLFTTPFELPQLQRYQLYTINETLVFLTQAVETYYYINNISTSSFAYGTNHNNKVECHPKPGYIKAYTYYWQNSRLLNHYINEVQTPLDLDFITKDESSYFHRLDALKLQFDLCNYPLENNPSSSSTSSDNPCYYWTIAIWYKFISQLYIEVTVDSSLLQSCNPPRSIAETVASFALWYDVFILLFAGLYLAYVVKDLYDSYLLYIHVKLAHKQAREEYLLYRKQQQQLLSSNNNNNNNNNSSHHHFLSYSHKIPYNPNNPVEVAAMYSWAEIPYAIKQNFHNYWSFLTFIAIVFAIIQSFIGISDPDNVLQDYKTYEKALLGLATLFFYVTIVQYLPRQSPIYSIAATIGMALPRIIGFFIGFLPVYLAFLFLGLALFGAKLGQFGSFELASKFIFSLMNGDSVKQILQLLSLQSIWASLLYGILFMILTAYLMLNILIAIVEEAYFIARKQGYRHLEVLMWRNMKRMMRNNNISNYSNDNNSDNQQQKNDKSSGELGFSQHIDDDVFQATTTNTDNNNDDNSSKGDSSNNNDSSSNNSINNNPENINTTTASSSSSSLPIKKDQLIITLAEETAEMYILGRDHWEYSKMMDYLVEHLQ